jgi:hypothetical protein
MLVEVDVVYESKANKRITVNVPDGLKGERLLTAVDKAVNTAMASDTEWHRWNLVNIKDEKEKT